MLRIAVPSMPKSSSPFMLKLVNLLEDMLKKPPAQLAVRGAMKGLRGSEPVGPRFR